MQQQQNISEKIFLLINKYTKKVNLVHFSVQLFFSQFTAESYLDCQQEISLKDFSTATDIHKFLLHVK